MLKRVTFIFAILLFSLGLVSCDATFQPISQDPHSGGLIPTYFSVSPREIIVNKPLNLKSYKKLIVVGIHNNSQENTDDANAFFVQSIKIMSGFKDVVLIDNLDSFLITSGYSNSQSSSGIYGLLGLSELRRTYGKFLFIDIAILNDDGSGWVKMIFTVIDPINAKVYFEVKRKVFNFAGIDKKLNYPVLNAFRQWVLKNSK